jgi:hypothetical protein
VEQDRRQKHANEVGAGAVGMQLDRLISGMRSTAPLVEVVVDESVEEQQGQQGQQEGEGEGAASDNQSDLGGDFDASSVLRDAAGGGQYRS